MKFYFYSKLNPNKEPILTQTFNNSIEATEFFSKLKNLTIDQFLELYNVEIKN